MRLNISLCFAIVLLSACGSGSKQNTAPPSNDDSVTPPVQVTPPNGSYLGFESVPVRPIARLGNQLFVTNTPNNRVEWFQLDANGLPSHRGHISVGLEPVALAFIDHQQLWVVNQLSDSVSIIDLSTQQPRVTRTLLVGDEPQDIVVAKGRVFISAAHRGQQLTNPTLQGIPGAGDPQLHQPGIGRADVWVFEPQQLGNAVGGIPKKIISLFGDSPRGLAVSPDQSHVYVGVFHSGNQTTAVHEAVLCSGYEDDEYGRYPCQLMDGITSPNGLASATLPGGRTAPGINAYGDYQPWTSMIVKYDPSTGQWQDSKGRNFSNGIRFNLPDKDIFALDSETLKETAAFSGVGTTIFNLAVHPTSGDLFISNTEANNSQRFEGKGEFAGSTVQGHIARTQVTHIDVSTGQVSMRHLNRHIDYSAVKAAKGTKQHSLSTPLQIALSSDGQQLYLAALGSNKVAVLNSEHLEDARFWDGGADDFNPLNASETYIDVPHGPAGLLLNEPSERLYVYTRFDNALVTIGLPQQQEIARFEMATPEPAAFRQGRFMLYDAVRTSSNGEASCASCHIFADTDHLSWNLGNPDERNTTNWQPFPTANISRLGCDLVGPNDPSCQLLELINGNGEELSIASMKGPMGTQSLRGMSTHGHMHWRGDRVNGYFGDDIEQQLDERQSFKNFIVAYDGLLGLDIDLPTSVDSAGKTAAVVALEQDMDKFADFMLSVVMPPNPIRNLDNSLSTSAQIGADFFHGRRRSDGLAEDVEFNGPEQDGLNCQGCHGVDAAKGFYGTRGEIAHGGEIQIFKVPQLRNLYTRVGMFGLPDREGFLPSHTKQHQGDQIRGFGFLHDGATDQLVNFLRGAVFDNGEQGCLPGTSSIHGCEFSQGSVGIPDEITRQGLVDYMMEFDNDIAPIVGQQVTLNSTTEIFVTTRVQLLRERAREPFTSKILGGQVTECDLVALGVVDGKQRGYLYLPETDSFKADQASDFSLSFTELQAAAVASENSLTFTCTLPGQGWRVALDNDMDGVLNGDQI